MAKQITTYAAFWPHYLRENARPETRRLHYAGMALTFLFLVVALAKGGWWWAALPLAGYGFAWGAHFGVEKNRPATFAYPFWSLGSDYRMFFLRLSGRRQHLRGGARQSPETAERDRRTGAGQQGPSGNVHDMSSPRDAGSLA